MFNKYEEIRLNAQMVATATKMDLDILCDTMIEYETESLVLRLKRFVYTSEEVDIEVPVPISAWEHVKKEYAPAWFLDRWPIKNKNITVKAKEAFPHLSYLTHNKARHLHLRIYEPLENVYCGT